MTRGSSSQIRLTSIPKWHTVCCLLKYSPRDVCQWEDKTSVSFSDYLYLRRWSLTVESVIVSMWLVRKLTIAWCITHAHFISWPKCFSSTGMQDLYKFWHLQQCSYGPLQMQDIILIKDDVLEKCSSVICVLRQEFIFLHRE